MIGMRGNATRSLSVLALLAGLGHAPTLWAAACANVATGNWTAAGTWAAPCNVAGGPTAADTVTIINNSTVTVNAAGMAANSVTIIGGINASALTFAAGSSLAVTNDVVVNPPTAAATKQISVAAGTLTVGGSVTLNGGTAATRDALLTVSTGLITINGGLIINATVATSSTASITAAGGRITVNGAAGVTNGDVVSIGAGTFLVTNAAAAFDNSSAANVASTTVSTGTLNIAGNLTNASGETMTVSSTGNITVGGTLANNGTITLTTTGVVNANGDFTNSATGVFTNTAAGNLNVGGNATMSGAFNSGTGRVTFNGAAAQALGGSVAPTFNNLTINKASNDLTISISPTVNGTLTFTSGKIVTGANAVILGTAGTIATPSATSYVVGNFRKNYAAAANLSYFAGDDFPVGDATSFTPVNVTAGTTTTAGSLTVATFTPDHPQVSTPIASTGIAVAQSVNRYWRFTNAGLTVGTAISATFTFVPGDIDPGAVTAGFIVQRHDGTNWNPTTIVAANPLDTQVSNITPLAAGNNDFAIGDPVSGFNGAVGAFNAFETTTPANAILGRIHAKLVGTPIDLSVVAVNAARTGVNAAFAASPITVALLDARDNSGALAAATNCRATWTTVISTQSIAVAWGGTGRVNVTITAPANAWRDVRVQVTQGANVGCSSDRFAIRPTAFGSVTSTMNNSGSSGAPSLKTGQNFTISVLTGLTGYDNGSGATLASPQIVPLIDNTLILGSPNAGTIGGTFGTASAGTATGAAFFYGEVGNFGLGANAIYDNAFTAVDQPGDCTADFSNALVGGRYGCMFGSPAIALAGGFGRFIPDNFDVSLNAPQFATACAAGAFTYTGQTFAYSTAPVLTVTARNGTSNGLGNAATINYAGVYMKITNAILTPNTQAARYSRFDALGGGTTPALNTGNVPGAPGVGSDPVIGAFASGVGTLTFSAGTGLSFTRGATPSSPFSADIALSINVLDSDGVAFAGNPAAFGAATAGNGVAFSSGKAMRFGRLRLQNAFGPLGNDLPVTLLAEYWNGTAFTTNTPDSCLTLVADNFALSGYVGGISAANMKPGAPAAGNVSVGGALANGVGTLRLTKPSPAAATPGGVVVCADLDGATPTDASCVATTPANLPWLKDNWGNATTYIDDPRSRATFGLFGAQPRQFIFLREYY